MKAEGGFYVARFRGPELEVDVSQGTTVTRMSFGVAAAWGRHFTTGEGGWFKAELFIGFFGIFEGTLAAVGNELQIERLAGSGGVLPTATASISLWIVSPRITIQEYAQLMVEYRAPTALLELTRPTRRLTRAIENQPFLLSRAVLRVSAEFVLQVTFVVEIDLYFTSYSQSISATYRLTVGQSFPL